VCVRVCACQATANITQVSSGNATEMLQLMITDGNTDAVLLAKDAIPSLGAWWTNEWAPAAAAGGPLPFLLINIYPSYYSPGEACILVHFGLPSLRFAATSGTCALLAGEASRVAAFPALETGGPVLRVCYDFGIALPLRRHRAGGIHRGHPGGGAVAAAAATAATARILFTAAAAAAAAAGAVAVAAAAAAVAAAAGTAAAAASPQAAAS
jgi:hypothetical protein